MKRKHLLSIAFITLLLASCSIEKRVYQSGYYISGRHASIDDLDATKRVKPIVVEEAQTLETTSDEIVVATEKITTSPKPFVSSDSTIEESITTNIHQTDKFQTETKADSIPDEGKILLAKYEKNHKAKDKISQIATYPLALVALGLFTVVIFFIPWLYGAMENDEWLIKFLLFCLFVFIFTIPLFIAYFILSRITKKQRRKLRRMGLVK